MFAYVAPNGPGPRLRSTLGVFEQRDPPPPPRERQHAATNPPLQGRLDPIDGLCPRPRLGPEIPRARRVATELERNQVILLVARRAARLVVLAHLHELQPVRVTDGRPNCARPAVYTDGGADRSLRHGAVQRPRCSLPARHDLRRLAP